MRHKMINSSLLAFSLTACVLGTVVLAQQGGRNATNHKPSTAESDRRLVAQRGDAPGEAAERDEDARSLEQKNQKIRTFLDKPSDLVFTKGTTLESFLKAIKQASTGPNDNGVPIFVNPVGLQETKQTMQSIVVVDRKGEPLRFTLRWALRSLGLSYYVEGGLLIIDSRVGVVEERLDGVEEKLDRLLRAVSRANRP